MPNIDQSVFTARNSSLSVNQVLRKTYMLLSATLVFSGLIAYWAMTTHVPPLSPFITIIGYFALLFITMGLRNSPMGIVSVFAFTGFLGYTLGPVLDMYLKMYGNGSQIISTSLLATGVIFFSLSMYALVTRKNFSYLGGFLMVAILAAFLLGIVGMLFHLTVLSLLVSGAFIVICSGLILFQTSMIINGGETNYILATINLYVALLNIFMNLLNILGAFSNRN